MYWLSIAASVIPFVSLSGFVMPRVLPAMERLARAASLGRVAALIDACPVTATRGQRNGGHAAGASSARHPRVFVRKRRSMNQSPAAVNAALNIANTIG